MKALWKRLAERFDALTLRERTLVFAAAMSVLMLAAYSGLLAPGVTKERRLTSEIARRHADLRALTDQVTKLVQSRQQDPDRELKQRSAALKARLADAEAGIAAEEARLTAPAQMRRVIEEMLAENRGVRLVSLRTLPVVSIAETRSKESEAKPAPQAGGAPTRLVFRHGIEFAVAGTYLDLLAYVGDLERLPTRLYWAALDIDASQHPTLTMKVTVYTLSLDRAWMSV